MNIYPWQMDPLLQLSTDLCNTTTHKPNKLHTWRNAHIPMAVEHTKPHPIEHRYMQLHYTQYLSHIEECTYTQGRQTPSDVL